LVLLVATASFSLKGSSGEVRVEEMPSTPEARGGTWDATTDGWEKTGLDVDISHFAHFSFSIGLVICSWDLGWSTICHIGDF
jgi:hypothetical protein